MVWVAGGAVIDQLFKLKIDCSTIVVADLHLMNSPAAPTGWNAPAHTLWGRGERGPAIQALLEDINRHGPKKPAPLVKQLSYYTFLVGNPAAAAGFLEATCPYYPEDSELLLNLAVCLSRSGKPAKAIVHLERLRTMAPESVVVWDSLASCLHAVGRKTEAAQAGTQSLVLKDRQPRPQAPAWEAPADIPALLKQADQGRRVVAFSLWGANPRYLLGALDNAIALPEVYPGWQGVFFVDESVPANLRQALSDLGAEVRLQPAGQGQRQKLAWRFLVANEAGVGRFLVRDVDSVVNERERAAVDAWLASTALFHVMRDWWTHTDLVLAGMWGGVAGVLPPIAPLLLAYKPPHMETPNVDQWFLRDILWPCLRQSALVHDRLFTPPGATPWPQPAPAGTLHVGQDVHAVARAAQKERLAPWIAQLPSLQEKVAP
jgi:tetratricopeptide (TPR) repeat protein